ncbi:MAG TPA: carboxypeptidase regulatory-like domain-containing protein [Actinomycetota bacterium]|nr:carboxypeptidase regulatory-like domain-containing protein [Actinomycetota bacterium]
MIDESDDRLVQWATRVAPDATVSLDPPTDGAAGIGVSLHLLDLADNPPSRGLTKPPLQISLRYLVSTWGPDVPAAHRLLGALVFAAMEDAEVEVELQPVAPALWAGLNVAPRPHFVLRVPLRLERPADAAPPVREPLVMELGTIRRLKGLVVGPGDTPIANAFVELPSLRLYARTDWRGLFEFPAVPEHPPTKKFSIRTKGRVFPVSAQQPASEQDPMLIRLDLGEA